MGLRVQKWPQNTYDTVSLSGWDQEPARKLDESGQMVFQKVKWAYSYPITNNMESCQKINGKDQTANFSPKNGNQTILTPVAFSMAHLKHYGHKFYGSNAMGAMLPEQWEQCSRSISIYQNFSKFGSQPPRKSVAPGPFEEKTCGQTCALVLTVCHTLCANKQNIKSTVMQGCLKVTHVDFVDYVPKKSGLNIRHLSTWSCRVVDYGLVVDRWYLPLPQIRASRLPMNLAWKLMLFNSMTPGKCLA